MRPSLTVLGLLILPTAIAAADLRFYEDAALHDVQFVDEKEGWAVGDDGLVLHTIDSGKTWERQPTGVQASLRSVHFLKNNGYIGWIAGRLELPYGRGSVGVLLYTKDGGFRWTQLLDNSMPGLSRVLFADPNTGYLLGDGSDQFPSGVFKTTDAGRTWEAVKGSRSASWLAGVFTDRDTGLLAGNWSRLAVVRPEGFGATNVDPLDGRNINGMHLSPHGAFAVGQGGLILASPSRGGRWGFADLKLPTPLLACLDFHGVHGVGSKLWVVGRPGSVVLHSKDAGNTWTMQPTNQMLPLNAVHFADEQNGWAVGALGSILGTPDGGKTWKALRNGQRRAAAMFVNADARSVPLDTIALLGADQGNFVTALRVLSPDAASAALDEACADRRLQAAVRQAGGVAAETLWQFPVPQHLRSASKKDLIRHWDQLHGGQAPAHVLRQLVLALRIWQPQVVIGDDPNADEVGHSPSALTAEALAQAVTLAGDAKAFPEQIEQLGLKPWRTTRLFAAAPREHAQVFLNCLEARRVLEASMRDFAFAATTLVADKSQLPHDERFYRLLDPADKSAGSLLEGIVVGEDGRRQMPADKDLTDDVIKSIQLRRNLDVIANRALRGEPNETSKLLAQIGPLLEKLPEEHGAAAAFAIASQYERAGQWALARETYLLMVDRYPAHPLSASAYRWLIQHNSSSEARRRHEQEHFLLVANSAFGDANPKTLIRTSADAKESGGVTQAVSVGKASLLQNQMETRQWHHGSLKIGQRLLAMGPVHGFDPAIQFCLQSSRRQLGDDDKAHDWYGKFRNYYSSGPWHEAAASELWLQNRAAPMPLAGDSKKSITDCVWTDAPPFLDGKLEDACWQDRKPMRFGNASLHSRGVKDTLSVEYPTDAWFAFDKQFLYLALRCGHPAAQHVPRETVRKRDDDLRRYDRVSLLLDLDRDYATYFHLQVDQRGCAREDCWSDLSWNPRWFVAVASNETGWNIEAAIPLAELHLAGVQPGAAWACNVVRTVPGHGVLAWSHPADVEPRPEGMSLLLFQGAVAKQGQ